MYMSSYGSVEAAVDKQVATFRTLKKCDDRNFAELLGVRRLIKVQSRSNLEFASMYFVGIANI